jgi:hypothetical protein
VPGLFLLRKIENREVDVWVLVDGQLRSSRQALRADQGRPHDISGLPLNIGRTRLLLSIDLKPNDFLKSLYEWGLYAIPMSFPALAHSLLIVYMN